VGGPKAGQRNVPQHLAAPSDCHAAMLRVAIKKKLSGLRPGLGVLLD